MPTFRGVRNDLRALERETKRQTDWLERAKTDGGRLTDFGNELVELCRRHSIPQTNLAAALNVTPAAISRRYGAPIDIR